MPQPLFPLRSLRSAARTGFGHTLCLPVQGAPFLHRGPDPLAEDLAQLHFRAEAAHVGNDAERRVGLGQQCQDMRKAHLLDFRADGMAHGIAEPHREKALRHAAAPDDIRGGPRTARCVAKIVSATKGTEFTKALCSSVFSVAQN